MSRWTALRPALPILIGASLMLSMAMGLRQSLGLFMPPLTRDIGISVSDFTIAISVQNLAWGLLQPFAGALAVRVGFRPLLLGGSVLYICGLVLLACAQGLLGVMLGAGIAIGAAMACTAVRWPWRWRRAQCRPPIAAWCWAWCRRPARWAR